MSSTLRITGLATGLDIDTMVKQMMAAEKTRVDKLVQDRQVVQWKQDLYRELIGELNTFKSTYFDVLKPETYMLSASNYSSFDIACTLNGIATTAVTATAGADAKAGIYKVSVEQLAQKASIQSSSDSRINVKEASSSIGFPIKITSENDQITIKDNSTTVDIALSQKVYGSLNELALEINSQLTKANLNESYKAVVRDGKINVDKVMKINKNDLNNNEITLDLGGESYKAELSDGNYTLGEIADIINGKLSSDGKDYKVEMAEESGSQKIILKDADGETAGDALLTLDMIKVSSESPVSADNIVSKPLSSGEDNKLYYKKAILENVNDTLTISIGGFGNIDISLTDLLKNYTEGEDITEYIAGELTNTIAQDSKVIELKNKTGYNDFNITVTKSVDGKLLFDSSGNYTVTLGGNAASTLGISKSFSIDQSVNDKMSNLFNDTDGKVSFTINDENFSYDFFGVDKDKKISDILNDISARANVDITYSQLTRQFVMKSKNSGSSETISAFDEESSSTKFLNKLFGNFSVKNGEDAKVTITNPDGESETIYKSSNNFTLDGVNYTLNNTTGRQVIDETTGEISTVYDNVTITLTSNTTKTFDKIKAFVDKYNEIIDKINTKLFEKKQYDYKPLTEDQKKEMNEDDIKNWEKKAKEGLLSNDSMLSNMLYSMRSAFLEPVKDSSGKSIGISLSDIGITTSRDYSQGGKLVIDEAKLKDALQNNGEKVAELFTKTSTSIPIYDPNLSGIKRGQRTSEEGIFQRLSDIIQDNLRTTRDNNGKKGLLLEKAGIKGDLSEFKNLLTEDLQRRDKIIKEMTLKLADKEERYYLQFSKLETAMQKLNDQSNWLYQQLGMGGN